MPLNCRPFSYRTTCSTYWATVENTSQPQQYRHLLCGSVNYTDWCHYQTDSKLTYIGTANGKGHLESLSVAVHTVIQNQSTAASFLWPKRVLLQAILANCEERNTASSRKPRCCHRNLHECCSDSSSSSVLFLSNSKLNGIFTLMRTLKNSESFPGCKRCFSLWLPCQCWRVFSEMLRHIASPLLCSDVNSVHSCDQVPLTDSICSKENSIGPTERDGKCLPDQPPRLEDV